MLASSQFLEAVYILGFMTSPQLQSQQQLFVLSNRLASFHTSFVSLNKEMKSYFNKSGTMRLNILLLGMTDLLMALRYIMAEIGISSVAYFFSLRLSL